MKDYNEIAGRVFEKGDRIIERKKIRAAKIRKFSLAASGMIAVFIVGFGIWKNHDINSAMNQNDINRYTQNQVIVSDDDIQPETENQNIFTTAETHNTSDKITETTAVQTVINTPETSAVSAVQTETAVQTAQTYTDTAENKTVPQTSAVPDNTPAAVQTTAAVPKTTEKSTTAENPVPVNTIQTDNAEIIVQTTTESDEPDSPVEPVTIKTTAEEIDSVTKTTVIQDIFTATAATTEITTTVSPANTTVAVPVTTDPTAQSEEVTLSNTTAAVTPVTTTTSWEEMPVYQQFPEFELDKTSDRITEIQPETIIFKAGAYLTDDSQIVSYIDSVEIYGYDELTQTTHTITAEIYKIKEYSRNSAAAVKFEGDDVYYIYFNTKHGVNISQYMKRLYDLWLPYI